MPDGGGRPMMGDIDWFGQTFGAFPEGSISQYNARVAKAMIRSGLAVTLVKTTSHKEPVCLFHLDSRGKKAADTAAQANGTAKRDGTHRCGVYCAITEEKQLSHKGVKALFEQEGGVNLAVSLPSRVVVRAKVKDDHGETQEVVEDVTRRVMIVDVDTDAERRAFLEDWAAHGGNVDLDTPLTVASPGVFRDATWKHKDGGHMWFDVPNDVELPATGEAKWCSCHRFTTPADGCKRKWSLFWTGSARYVLVPPSVRPEGPYRATGQAMDAPEWLVTIARESTTRTSAERTGELNNDDGDPINAWASSTPWAELLNAAGWAEWSTEGCGCSTWTRPGHANPKTATAHDPGCSQMATDGGHGFLHLWTDAWRPGGKSNLTKLDFVAHEYHGGDTKAAMDALGIERSRGDSSSSSSDDVFVLGAIPGKGDAPESGGAANDEGEDEKEGDGPAGLMDMVRASIVNWGDLLNEDFTAVEWLAGKLLAKGQQVALVGDGKAGKSVFSQEWAWRMSAGLPFLDDEARDPIRVLYLDGENGRNDLQARFISFGVELGNLPNLVYASFPPIPPLDTAVGGAVLMALAQEVEAEVVWIDTVSRFISGAENDADTWLSLYRHTLMKLKNAGIASIRLDHFGKDKDRGARGNSAKTQDVDHVWELAVIDEQDSLLALKRTHTRTGIGEGFLRLHRQGERVDDQWVAGGTRHVLAAAPDPFTLDGSDLEPRDEGIMREICRVLKGYPDGLPKAEIEKAMKGVAGKAKIATAVKHLQAEERVKEVVGEKNARRQVLISPFDDVATVTSIRA